MSDKIKKYYSLSVVALIYLSFFIAAISVLSGNFEFSVGIVNGVFLMSVLFMMSVAALVINHVSLAKKFGHLTMLLSEVMIGLSLYAIIYFI